VVLVMASYYAELRGSLDKRDYTELTPFVTLDLTLELTPELML